MEGVTLCKGAALGREERPQSQSKCWSLSCVQLCEPMDCSPLGFSVCGILQTRILEWVAFPSSRGSSQPRDRTQVSHIAGRLYSLSRQGSRARASGAHSCCVSRVSCLCYRS